LIVQSLYKRYRITAAGELLLNGGRVQEVNVPFLLRYSRNLLLLAAIAVIHHWWLEGFDSTVLRSVVTNTALIFVCLWQKNRYLQAIAQAKESIS
jgi:hypothetical protein